MPLRSSRLASRSAALLLVAAAHVLVIWAFWRAPSPQAPEVLVFTSTLPFPPSAVRDTPTAESTTSGNKTAARRAPPRPARPRESALRNADAGPITLPPVPGANVDWSAQLTLFADSALQNQQTARDQRGALTRRFIVPTDPRNPGDTVNRDFRWYDQGIHRIDTRGPLPALWLSDHCVLLAFIMPFCMVGHIEIHGDLLDRRAIARDESEAAPRLNDAP